MKKQIQLLARKAGGNPNYAAFRGYFLPPPPDYIDPATVDLQKFAQLIVQECVRYFNEDYTRNFDVLWREDLSKAIKQHFEVTYDT